MDLVMEVRKNAHKPAQMVDLMQRELDRLSRLSSEEVAREQSRTCKYCGGLLVPRWMEIKSDLCKRGGIWIWPDRHGCQQEHDAQIERREREKELEAASALQRYRNALKRAALIGLRETYTFESFKDRADWLDATKVLFRVKEYAYAIARGDVSKPWLILYGDVGMGKSHLAGAVLRDAIDNGVEDVYFRDWARYLQRIKASWRTGHRDLDDDYGAETEEDIIRELARGQIVAIDDLDKQPATDWSRGVLYAAINQRYSASLPAILTFNHSLTDRLILDYIGPAVLDRIVQHAYDVIEFRGPSYRCGMAAA